MISLRIKIRNRLTWFLTHLIKFSFKLKLQGSIIGAVVSFGQKISSNCSIPKSREKTIDGRNGSVDEPRQNLVVNTVSFFHTGCNSAFSLSFCTGLGTAPVT